ncbi:hypothetical protein WICPIJ_006696 [Wickerhamomyces pijperi]|uniref:Uncharacterized protein n=1 Tax=Wickerhamomyces pijperi TaxID=599730 RepID=A0A9P8TKQ1_WICPI|nr:hypothetical protein WICPIJ_006696 [Wickerhamomyces pijperi]
MAVETKKQIVKCIGDELGEHQTHPVGHGNLVKEPQRLRGQAWWLFLVSDFLHCEDLGLSLERLDEEVVVVDEELVEEVAVEKVALGGLFKTFAAEEDWVGRVIDGRFADVVNFSDSIIP